MDTEKLKELLARVQTHIAVGCVPQHGYYSRHEQLAIDIEAAINALPSLLAELEQARRDAGRWRWLRDSQACALHIEHNDHHAVYESAEAKIRWQENDPKADYFGEVPEDEKRKMIDADSIWTLHIYPNTPVGFNVYHAATLDTVIDAAMEAQP